MIRDFSFNNLTSIPEAIGKYPALQDLYVAEAFEHECVRDE